MDREEISNLYRGPTWQPQAIHVYDCMLYKKKTKKNLFFCGKGDNSNLNIDISQIQLAMN
jgi:hypothetical protein